MAFHLESIHSKNCGEQLAGVYIDVFNLSLTRAAVHEIFESSIIITVPKKPEPSTHNDYSPVALTPVVMKCLEKLIFLHINSVIPDCAGPLHHTLQHVDCSRTYARMLFMDYNSALNTIHPRKVIVKLSHLGVPTTTCNWILDFFTDKPQAVRVGGKVSAELTVSTGSLQGYCLSPKLFTLYTHDCVSTQENPIVISYTDDTAIQGLIKGEDEAGYRTVVKDIMGYREDNGLILESIADFRKKAAPLQSHHQRD